jgi:hypothetical protein
MGGGPYGWRIGCACLGTFALIEMDDLPRRWPRRQAEDESLEAGDGEVPGLGVRRGMSAEGALDADDWDSLVSNRDRRGEWN